MEKQKRYLALIEQEARLLDRKATKVIVGIAGEGILYHSSFYYTIKEY